MQKNNSRVAALPNLPGFVLVLIFLKNDGIVIVYKIIFDFKAFC
jgi:hypothetical protein